MATATPPPLIRKPMTAADLVVIALSPALIMGLVGSLVFFLIEILYGGDYAGRVRWTMFFFVFGIVLVSRMTIEFNDGRAAIYGLCLGGVTLLAMMRFVELGGSGLESVAPLINIGLMAIVWWCAYKLTWDCTFLDENRDASDQSLLEASGLVEEEHVEKPAEPEPETGRRRKRKSFWERYEDWKAERAKKPHTPGVWVIYFSLAALPIFGLGQALIPSDSETGLASRRFTFWLMVVYVACGLGLLSTTTFLGLRRYLRQRNLTMPKPMVGMWLAVGGGMILAFLVVGAVLPRPNAEYSLLNLSKAGSKERDASNYAQMSGDEGKGEGSGGKTDDDAESGGASGKGKKSEGGGTEGGKGKGQNQDGKGAGGDGKQSDQSGGDQKGEKSGDRGEKKDDGPNQKDDPKGKQAESEKGRPGGKQSSGKRTTSSKRSSRGPIQLGWLSNVASVLKWVVFAALAVLVVFFLFRHGLKFLAQFSDWAKGLLDWLNNLFGGSKSEAADDAEPEPEEPKKPRRPFSWFRNPFDSDGESRPPEELVKYSFAALEAWAEERGLARQPEETPLEFTHRVAKAVAALKEEAPRLGGLYARLAYAARGRLPASGVEATRSFWLQLEQAHADEREAEAAAESR
jgi:Domain of unknown function (DUF4129)